MGERVPAYRRIGSGDEKAPVVGSSAETRGPLDSRGEVEKHRAIQELLPHLPFLFVGLSLAAVAAVLLWSRKRERERREGLVDFSHRSGYSFAETDDSLPPAALSRSHLFDQGRRRRVANVLRRTEGGIETIFFDYRYTTGGGKNSTTHRQSVVLLRLEEETVPTFQLRPEHLFHRIGAKMGFQDIDFDDSPEFSRKYLLRGSDEEAIRRLFDSSVRHWFEANTAWSVEGAGSWLVVYRHAKRVKLPELTGFLEECQGVRRALTGS